MDKAYTIAFVAIMTLCLLLFTGSCLARAPVVDLTHRAKASQKYYRVRHGDTLYSIAWAYSLDFRQLAKINGLNPDSRIRPGQRIRLWSHASIQRKPIRPKRLVSTRRRIKKTPRRYGKPKTKTKTKSATTRKRVTVKRNRRYVNNKPIKNWIWPAKGKIIRAYAPSLTGNKGIDIAGRMGDPVRAVAAGKVVYSGSGLRGYGRLIIIKHNNHYLSAYAHNKKLLVKEGAWVKTGQKIALMGKNNAGRVMLHFEIRRNGKPVNPIRYLGKIPHYG